MPRANLILDKDILNWIILVTISEMEGIEDEGYVGWIFDSISLISEFDKDASTTSSGG